MKEKHTMSSEKLLKYCESKIHPLLKNLESKKIVIVPEYDRSKDKSSSEKVDKRFNWKRPTADVQKDVGYLYIFPGEAYIRHYKKIYEQVGYSVEVKDLNTDIIRSEISKVFPNDFPHVDTVILGYVEPLASTGTWEGDGDIQWKLQSIKGELVAFVGVKFSYWGDIIYYVTEKFSNYCSKILYIGKLGSLNEDDEPNKTLATGNVSSVNGEMIEWENIFEDSPLVVKGKHLTVPSVLDETHEWFIQNNKEYRFVDPELGWIAKASRDFNLKFSYLHLITDNLHANFLEDLTTEREDSVLKKRYQYVGIIRSILWHTLGREQEPSLYTAVMNAQQKRVDRGLMKALERNWNACLSFAYHTQEEAWEVVRELPRREWKDQEVIPEQVLSEIADTQIQLLTTLMYAGYSEEDLENAVLEKLGAKREDWK
jgi:hypothetical protein